MIYILIIKNTTSIKLYQDNGNRVVDYINTDNTLPCLEFQKCKVDEGCKNCSGKCIHFSNDVLLEDGHLLEGSLDPNEGYCMLNLIDDRSSKKCSGRNGGKWVLTTNDKKSGEFYFKCFCSIPHLYMNGEDGDCTLFRGCQGGSLDTDSDVMKCNCPDNMVEIKTSNGVPTCVARNYFHTKEKDDVDLDPKFLNPKFSKFNLPNPCIYDFLNKKFIIGAGEIIIEDGVAFCRVLKANYTTVRFQDDYLLNNGGKYANGIVRISSQPPTPGYVYETRTKNENGDIEEKVGKRFQAMFLDFKLPYLDSNSGNRGGTGPMYNFAAQLTKFENSYVYVYEARRPTQRSILDSESTIVTFRPTYIATGLNVANRTYMGTVPFMSGLTECGKCYILGTLHKFLNNKYKEFNEKNAVRNTGQTNQESDELTSTYTMPNFCLKGSKRMENVYTKTFTGIYYDDTVVISPISPGSYLVNLYRSMIEGWTPFKVSSYLYLTNVDQFATNAIGAGLTADGIDCEEVANPPRRYARYTCTGDTFSWPTEH